MANPGYTAQSLGVGRRKRPRQPAGTLGAGSSPQRIANAGAPVDVGMALQPTPSGFGAGAMAQGRNAALNVARRQAGTGMPSAGQFPSLGVGVPPALMNEMAAKMQAVGNAFRAGYAGQPIQEMPMTPPGTSGFGPTINALGGLSNKEVALRTPSMTTASEAGFEKDLQDELAHLRGMRQINEARMAGEPLPMDELFGAMGMERPAPYGRPPGGLPGEVYIPGVGSRYTPGEKALGGPIPKRPLGPMPKAGGPVRDPRTGEMVPVGSGRAIEGLADRGTPSDEYLAERKARKARSQRARMFEGAARKSRFLEREYGTPRNATMAALSGQLGEAARERAGESIYTGAPAPVYGLFGTEALGRADAARAANELEQARIQAASQEEQKRIEAQGLTDVAEINARGTEMEREYQQQKDKTMLDAAYVAEVERRMANGETREEAIRNTPPPPHGRPEGYEPGSTPQPGQPASPPPTEEEVGPVRRDIREQAYVVGPNGQEYKIPAMQFYNQLLPQYGHEGALYYTQQLYPEEPNFLRTYPEWIGDVIGGKIGSLGRALLGQTVSDSMRPPAAVPPPTAPYNPQDVVDALMLENRRRARQTRVPITAAPRG